MRIALVYPPCNNRNCEPFPMPNIAVAALHGYLRAHSGADVSQADLDRAYFSGLREKIGPAGRLLADTAKITAYAGGRTGPVKKRLDALADAFMAAGGLDRCDLLGITFADLREDPLILNCSALIAKRAKDLWGCKVAVGHSNVSERLYREILARYKVFDFAVFSEWGGESLLRLAQRSGGARVKLVNTLEFAGGGITAHYNSPAAGRVPPSPFYPAQILEQYKVEDRQLAASYYTRSPEIKRLLGRGDTELVVPYSFINTCSGSCAFCSNDAAVPSNCKSIGQVVGELAALKKSGVTGLYFINSNFNDKYAYADELCGEMIKRGFNFLWSDCANLRNIDEKLLAKMGRAGAIKLTFGMETGSDRLLKYIRKGITVEKIEKYLRFSHGLGIVNHIELIGGLPHETEEDIRLTSEFILRNRETVDIYSLNPFYLYPASPFARRQAEFGLKVLGDGPPKTGAVSEKFDETGGLAWKAKDRQIIRSAGKIAEVIERVSSYGSIDYEHIHLRAFLYRKLGRRNKELIRKIVGVMTRSFRPYNLARFMSGFDYSKHKWVRTRAR